jgi:DNA-binding winged helix-turn-helix (wHTH) protein
MSTLVLQASSPSSWSTAFRLTSHPSNAMPGSWGSSRPLHLRAVPLPSVQAVVEDFRFGPFRLLLGCRTLLFEGRPVECGGRAFDLLHALLLGRGRIVSKEDIIKHVWPTTCVEESNLRFQMACLRKILGGHRDLIKTIPGRGYLLASDWPNANQTAV